MLNALGTAKSAAAVALLLGALIAGLFFYGTGDNLVMLVASAALLLAALSVLGTRDIRATFADAPAPMTVACATLLLLVFEYQWSFSKDSSFAPTWVLAALPLAFVAGRRLDAASYGALRAGCSAVGALLASISVFRFVAFGERAHLPLVDPNNYATLMYLLWIPFVHEQLCRRWRGAASDTSAKLRESLVSFVLLAALFATRSRTAATVVVVALVLWTVFAAVRRLGLRGPLLHAGIAALALGSIVATSTPLRLDGAAASLGMGTSIRLDLVESAWHMFRDHPFSGVGVFCFGLMYGAYRLPSEQLTAGLFVHNDYVQFLAEGGVLLAVLPLLLGATAAWKTLRGARAAPRHGEFERLGPALAVAAACAHATVNFVFFSLPLAIVLGVLAAGLFERRSATAPAQKAGSRPERATAAATLAFGWIAWAYLALDLVTIAVFQGQPGVPFAGAIRVSPAAQLDYARLAHTLNGSRGIPLLGEAALLAQRAARNDAPAYLAERTLVTFRDAVRVDPWNSMTYVMMADFVARHIATLPLQLEERPEALLLRALATDPVYAPAIDRLLRLYEKQGRDDRSLELLRKVVFPWIELLKRRDDVYAERYLAEMVRLATAAGDDAFVAEVAARREALARVKPVERTSWFL